MSKMKDSRIQWIGNIPEEWKKIKIKNVCQKVFAGGTPSTDIEEYWNGNIPWLPSGACHDKYIETANIFITEKGFKNSSTKLIPANTTLIAMTGATCGNTGYLTFDSCANQSVTAYINDKKELNSLYLFYALQAAREYILTYQTGGAQAGINVDNCKNFIIPIANIKEQKLIADFLDEKVNTIDNIICELNSQIEILNKYKKQLISESVTEGLSKKNFKNSKISFIKKIPDNWEEVRTINVLKMPITDGPHETPDLYDDGIPFVSAEAVSCGNGRIDFEHIRGYISEDYYRQCCKKYVPKLNDIYMIKSGATTGKVSIVDTDIIFTIWSPLAVFRANTNKILYKFLYYALNSEYYQMQVQTNWTYGTQQNIGMRTLEKLKIVLPPIIEQMEIVNYLDKKCSEIEEILNSKINQKEQMEQYKKSVIYEYVTGKKRVEGAEELYG